MLLFFFRATYPSYTSIMSGLFNANNTRTVLLEKDSPFKDLQHLLTTEEQADPSTKLFASQEGPDKTRIIETLNPDEDILDEVVAFVPNSDKQHALLPLIYIRLMLGDDGEFSATTHLSFKHLEGKYS